MRIVSLAAVALATALVAVITPGVAQAADREVDECLDWKYNGFPPDYCVIDQDQAHVIAYFTNSSDRELRFLTLSGDNRNWERIFVLKPGERTSFWGNSNAGKDISGSVSFCSDQVTYSRSCEGHVRLMIGWKNPFIGWPWMKVGADEHGFRAMERYTFESAHGTAASKGVSKFKTQRLTDKASGTKRYQVDFTFAIR
jgi:hypothetical protein